MLRPSSPPWHHVGSHGYVGLHPQAGTSMGHVLAPKVFVKDFSRTVGGWNSTCHDQSMMCKEECTVEVTDLSVGLFVDDVAKLYLATLGETQQQLFGRTVHESNRLAGNMLDNGHNVNRDKAVSVLGLAAAACTPPSSRR